MSTIIPLGPAFGTRGQSASEGASQPGAGPGQISPIPGDGPRPVVTVTRQAVQAPGRGEDSDLDTRRRAAEARQDGFAGPGLVQTRAPEAPRLQIERNDEARRFVYKAVDPGTGEVVSQYPPEEVLRRIAFYIEAEAKISGRAESEGRVLDQEA